MGKLGLQILLNGFGLMLPLSGWYFGETLLAVGLVILFVANVFFMKLGSRRAGGLMNWYREPVEGAGGKRRPALMVGVVFLLIGLCIMCFGQSPDGPRKMSYGQLVMAGMIPFMLGLGVILLVLSVWKELDDRE